jgi:hypothetical protein
VQERRTAERRADQCERFVGVASELRWKDLLMREGALE